MLKKINVAELLGYCHHYTGTGSQRATLESLAAAHLRHDGQYVVGLSNKVVHGWTLHFLQK